MIEIKTKVRRWGNSFGVVLPQKALGNKAVKEGDEIVILVKPQKINLKKLVGGHKFSKPTDVLMKEIDKDLYND